MSTSRFSPNFREIWSTTVGRRTLAIGLAAIVWIGLPGSGLLFWGKPFAEKVLTELALPAGLVWSLLWGGCLTAIWSGKPRRTILLWFLGWLAFTIVGNRWLAGKANDYWEQGQFDSRPAGVYDLLVVLGGGLNMDFRGESQVNNDGQRVVLAVQQYHAGKAKRILVTGSSIPGYGRFSQEPSESGRRLIMSLGVPGDLIETVSGRNTTEELKSLKQYLSVPGREAWRVGMITSAFHMPRAERLASELQLNLEPLPTAFRTSGELAMSPVVPIPEFQAIDTFRRLLRELLGGLVGR